MSATVLAYALTLHLYSPGDVLDLPIVDTTETSIYQDSATCRAAADSMNELNRMPPALAELYGLMLSADLPWVVDSYEIECTVVVAAPPVDPAFYGDE